jgi:quinol monooxygenase YgiN
MQAGMRSEQVYWVFTVTVDQMDKFTPLIPKLVAATEKEPGALQFECNIGDDQKTVDFFERYTDSKAALFHQTESAGHDRERGEHQDAETVAEIEPNPGDGMNGTPTKRTRWTHYRRVSRASGEGGRWRGPDRIAGLWRPRPRVGAGGRIQEPTAGRPISMLRRPPSQTRPTRQRA